MDTLFDKNGLLFWTEQQIDIRNTFVEFFRKQVALTLRATNRAWQIFQVEAPILTPRPFVNQNYGAEDMYIVEDLVLRPETTPGSYVAAKTILDQGAAPPICVWQVGKSFRREQDQPLKQMKLKEFYQQEFQCIYTEDTANDYHAAVLPSVSKMIANMVGLPTRVVESDRLPSYSKKTMDVEVDNGDKWMEVASISLRTDFPHKVKFKTAEKALLVVEIAIGVDRCVYNYFERCK